MSAEKLISTMEKLLKLHKSLYELAQKKTEKVKIGDIDALNQILKDEQAHLTAINLLENERQKYTSSLVPGTEKPTMEDCIAVVDESARNKLDRLRSELKNMITEIQQRNELNQQMLFQSLQFVNLSLNLIAPQPEDYNYGPQAEQARSTGLLNLKA
jgi:flagellar biosynthesis/type III secretory pathway chaperone